MLVDMDGCASCQAATAIISCISNSPGTARASLASHAPQEPIGLRTCSTSSTCSTWLLDATDLRASVSAFCSCKPVYMHIKAMSGKGQLLCTASATSMLVVTPCKADAHSSIRDTFTCELVSIKVQHLQLRERAIEAPLCAQVTLAPSCRSAHCAS